MSSNFPALNDAGQVQFFSTLIGTSGGVIDDEGIFRGTGGPLVQIARGGQAAPDGDGRFAAFRFHTLNNSGQAAFVGDLFANSGGSSENSAIFRVDGGSLVQLAREGQAAPDANGNLRDFGPPSLNDAGQTSFRASLTATSGGASDNSGIFLGNGGPLNQIVRRGQVPPDGNGSFDTFNTTELNDVGQVAFSASLSGTPTAVDDSGIFRGAGGPITQIARGGQVAPHGIGNLYQFSTRALNSAGMVAVHASLIYSDGNRGIYRGDGGPLTQIVHHLQTEPPDGNGTFFGFGAPSLNDAGQVAFLATFSGTSGGSSDAVGIFLFDDSGGLMQLARAGTPLLGSTVTGLGFIGDNGQYFDDRRGFNELGQVVYRFELAMVAAVLQSHRYPPSRNRVPTCSPSSTKRPKSPGR